MSECPPSNVNSKTRDELFECAVKLKLKPKKTATKTELARMIVDYKKEHPKKNVKALAKTVKSSPKKRNPQPITPTKDKKRSSTAKNGITVELKTYHLETTIRKEEFTFNFECSCSKHDVDKWKKFIQNVNLKKYASITASDYEIPQKEISLSSDDDGDGEHNSFEGDGYIYHGINYRPDGTLIFKFESFIDNNVSSFTIKGRDVDDFIKKLEKTIISFGKRTLDKLYVSDLVNLK